MIVAPSRPLRAQIATTVVMAMVALAILLVGLSELHERRIQQRLLAVQAHGEATLVNAVQSLEGAALGRLNLDAVGQAEVLAFLSGPDADTAAAAGQRLAALTEPLRPSPAMLLLDRSGEPGLFHGMSDIDGRFLAAAIAPMLGVERRFETPVLAPDGSLLLMVASEVRLGVNPIGHVVSISDLGARIARFGRSSDEAVAVVAPGGGFKPLRGDTELLAAFSPSCCSAEARSVPAKLGARHILVSSAPLAAPGGDVVAAMVSLRDVTEDRRRDTQLTIITIVLSLTTILLALGLLLRSLRRALRPLGATVRLLRRLAEGRTDVSLRPMRAAREIETLVETVDAFRQGLDAQKSLAALTEQLESARRIQQALLPHRLDLAEGLEIHGAMRPVQDVGGDFFDVFRLEDGRIVAIAADVSGKGIGAALFAALASMALRSNTRAVREPAAVIEATNNELCRRNREDLFISVFLAIIDPQSGEMLYVNAGHCPPFLISGGQEASLLPYAEDLVLGVMPGMPYTLGRHVMAPGETLFLYTDGFDEAQRSDGAQIGAEGAQAIVKRCADAADATQQLVEGVFSEIDAFAGDAPQADDITILAIRRRA